MIASQSIHLFCSSEMLKQYNKIILVLQNVCQGASLTVC